jgi:DNA-binding response OmpR family regulator
LVAAMTRTSTLISVGAADRRISRSCSTRSSLTCSSSGISPISSRNSVPPSASSNRPGLSRSAPVNAPFSWPNSSLSSRFSGIAAQLTRDERRVARGCCWWIARATSSLPVPLSPHREREAILVGVGAQQDRDVGRARQELERRRDAGLDHLAGLEPRAERLQRLVDPQRLARIALDLVGDRGQVHDRPRRDQPVAEIAGVVGVVADPHRDPHRVVVDCRAGARRRRRARPPSARLASTGIRLPSRSIAEPLVERRSRVTSIPKKPRTPRRVVGLYSSDSLVMSRTSRIIVADADAKNAGLLAFGFEREGIEPVVVHAAADVPRMAIAGNVDAVVVSMASVTQAAEALKGLRAAGPLVAKLPVLGLGDAAARAEVLGAGAVDFLPRPNFVRDVVAMVRFHTLRKPSSPSVWAGDLGDFAGIFYLIRGLSSAQRTGVLTIVRSLRRAELRFYEGEVTSAQVGSLHGMAALHQVLLWTEGKLDFRAESVVRRQQIPLQPGELIDDLGRFLRDFHELAPDLGPGVVLEQDLRRVAECVDKIPKEVNPVLRLFDGARLLSDIVEDSPFRVFETVKIAARLVKLGALKPVVQSRARGENSALKVDDWLVGSTPVQGVPALVAARDSEPVGPRSGVPASPPGGAAIDTSASVASARQKKKAKKERERAGSTTPSSAPGGDGVVSAPVKPAASEPTDWGRLTGAASSVWDLPGYAPVVPSQVATGEISSITRPSPDANLATAGKVVAQDLFSAVHGVVRTIQGDSGPTPKVMVSDDATAAPLPAITGKAVERVEDISAPVPVPIATTPAVQTLPGPAPVPVAPAPVRQSQPIAAEPPPAAVAAEPAPAPAPAPKPAPARRSQPITVEPPVIVAPEPVDSRMHAPSGSLPDGNGVFSGVLSGGMNARSSTPSQREPEVAEKIVVIDADFDPPRPPSVEIEIVRAPPDEEDEATPQGATDVDQPSAPHATPAVQATSSPPALRSIADEEPSDAAAARAPNVLLAPHGLAPAVPLKAQVVTVVGHAAPASPSLPVAEPIAAPEAVVHATPSAPTLQMTASADAPTRLNIPTAVAAPAPTLLGSPPPQAIVPATPAPVVALPAASIEVTEPTVVAPAPAAAAVAAEVTRGAADAAAAAARALAFDAIDEEFFNQEHQFANAKAHPSESFDDLDGHHHAPPPKRGFWSRLLGNAPPPQVQRRTRPTTAPPPTGNKTTGPQKTAGPQKPTGPQKTQPVQGKKPQGGGKKR